MISTETIKQIRTSAAIAKGDFLDRHSNYARKIIRNDWDWWTANEGMEGTGKSSLSIWQGHKVGRGLFKVENNIVWDPEDFLRLIDTTPQYGVIILDEAGEAVFSRDFMADLNKSIVKASQQMRDRNLYVIYNLPSLGLLDSALRRRFKTLVIYEAPNFIRGRSLWHVPVHNRYGIKTDPYWDFQQVYYFHELPPNTRAIYKEIKTRLGKERVAKYLEQVEMDKERSQDIDPHRLVDEIVRMPKEERAELLSSKGSWSRDKVRFRFRCSESVARTVVAGLGSTIKAE